MGRAGALESVYRLPGRKLLGTSCGSRRLVAASARAVSPPPDKFHTMMTSMDFVLVTHARWSEAPAFAISLRIY